MENTTSQTAAVFRETYPLDFDLYDENDQPVLYIEDGSIGHNVAFVIRNTSTRTLNLTPPGGNNTAAADNFHFELRFRPGTLSSGALAQLSIVEAGWNWQHGQQADGTHSLYLLYTAVAPPALAPDDALSITLQNVSAAADGGARGTRVELRYQQLTTGTGDAVNGNRLQHASIVNARGRRNIPLHVGFVGSNMVLNNNTANNLALRITNTLRNDNFRFNPETRLVLSFDADDTPDRSREYALATLAEVAAITVTAAGWTVTPPPAQALTPEWLLSPAAGAATLEPGQHIQIELAGIITAHPNGYTNVYLHYENISGYADGQFVAGIEKAPLIYQDGRVGIGTTEPAARLQIINANQDANGNTLILGPTNQANLRLGYDQEYSWIQSHGSRPLAINPVGNNVGIGTTNPQTKLHILSQSDPTLKLQSDGTNEVSGRVSLRQSNDTGADMVYDGRSATEGLAFHLIHNEGGLVQILNPPPPPVFFLSNHAQRFRHVGINTSTPTARLHVNNDNAAFPALLLASPNASSWQLRIHNLSQNSYQVGMRVTNDGFFDVTNRANLASQNSARLNSAGTWTVASDRRFKEEIQPVHGILDKVMALQPVSFRYKGMESEGPPLVGFIAQDVEAVFPHLVTGSEDKYLDYAGFGPLAIRAIQEMKQQYDDRIAHLEQTMTRLLARLEGQGDKQQEAQA